MISKILKNYFKVLKAQTQVTIDIILNKLKTKKKKL